MCATADTSRRYNYMKPLTMIVSNKTSFALSCKSDSTCWFWPAVYMPRTNTKRHSSTRPGTRARVATRPPSRVVARGTAMTRVESIDDHNAIPDSCRYRETIQCGRRVSHSHVLFLSVLIVCLTRVETCPFFVREEETIFFSVRLALSRGRRLHQFVFVSDEK